MSSKTILIVEDDPVSAEAVSEYLRAHGYLVETAETGPKGLSRFHQHPPDLVLIDVQLPVKNGFEVAHQIRNTDGGRDVPLVLMSAVYTNEARGAAYVRDGLHADGYLVKPFELADMLKKVTELIGGPEAG